MVEGQERHLFLTESGTINYKFALIHTHTHVHTVLRAWAPNGVGGARAGEAARSLTLCTTSRPHMGTSSATHAHTNLGIGVNAPAISVPTVKAWKWNRKTLIEICARFPGVFSQPLLLARIQPWNARPQFYWWTWWGTQPRSCDE